MAVEEPAALRCGLALPHERTKHTWFRFLPGFRTRKEGEPIRMGDTVVVQSMKKSSNLNMHIGKDDEGETNDFKPRAELNLCTPVDEMDVGNTWRRHFRIVPVAKFSTSEKSQGDAIVRGGDYVEVFHRQSQGYLAVDRRHHNRQCRLFRPIPDSKEADPVSTMASELVWKLMTPEMAWSGANVTIGGRDDDKTSSQALCLNAASQCGDDLFLAEGEDGYLELVLNADNLAAQWYLQPFDSVDGGLRYDLTKFYLVNAETGNVLQQGKEDAEKDPGAGDGHAWFQLKAISATIEHESDVFVLHPLNSAGESSPWLTAFQTAEEGLDSLWEFHKEMEDILAMDKSAGGQAKGTTTPASPKSGKGASKRRRQKKGNKHMLRQLEDGLKTLPHRNLHLGFALDRDHLPPSSLKVRRLLAAACCLFPTCVAELLCPMLLSSVQCALVCVLHE
jgi:hypothetical protein|eukprot:COSAG02_NODE_2072_length_9932_cov_1196.463439_3_plen_448_part_00